MTIWLKKFIDWLLISVHCTQLSAVILLPGGAWGPFIIWKESARQARCLFDWVRLVGSGYKEAGQVQWNWFWNSKLLVTVWPWASCCWNILASVFSWIKGREMDQKLYVCSFPVPASCECWGAGDGWRRYLLSQSPVYFVPRTPGYLAFRIILAKFAWEA